MPLRIESSIGDGIYLHGKGINLLKLSRRQRIDFLDSFDGVFISCEGILWMLWGPIPNAGFPVLLFKTMGKTVRFLTNNGLRSDEEMIEILETLGIDGVVPTDIVSPVKTMIRFAKRTMPGKPVYSLGGPAVNYLLQKSGIKLKTMKPQLQLTVENLVHAMVIEDKVGAVFMDVNLNLTISELVRAQQYLEDPECLLICGANNNIIPLSEKVKTIGPGGFINLLRESSGKDPITVDKSPLLHAELMEQFSIKKPSRYLYIGDSLNSDITFANRCGFLSLLILSETVKDEDIQKLRMPERPDYMLHKWTDFIDFMADLN